VEHRNIVPALAGKGAFGHSERSIGTILIHAGRLTLEQAEQILRLQREQGLRFGDAAIQLGLLTPADIDFALARQFDYPYLIRGEAKVSESVIAAYAPFSPQVQALGALRGQLMLRWFDTDPDRTALTIISAERRDGRSFIAANLAVTFSQLGQRTLLVDADMRNPVQHALFGLGNAVGLSAVLGGRSDPEAAIHSILGLPDLSLMPAGAPPPNPLELLARPQFPRLLKDLVRGFDVVLFDSPPASEHPDAQAVAVRAGAALIVVRKNATRSWSVRGVSEKMTHASATVLGSVLNDY